MGGNLCLGEARKVPYFCLEKGGTMKKVFFIVLITLLCGCEASIQNTSQAKYIKPEFTQGALEGGGLAFLPILAGQGQEAYRRPLADSISHDITNQDTNLKFYDTDKTTKILQDKQLIDSYQRAILSYSETSILNKQLLTSISDSLGIRYLLLISLKEFNKVSHGEYNYLTGVQTVTNAKVQAFAQIWDCTIGDIVWEGQASAESEGGELTYTAAYEKYCGVAAQGLVDKLFTSVNSNKINKP